MSIAIYSIQGFIKCLSVTKLLSTNFHILLKYHMCTSMITKWLQPQMTIIFSFDFHVDDTYIKLTIEIVVNS